MQEYLLKHDIINPQQHRFRQGISCFTNLLETFEDLYSKENKPARAYIATHVNFTLAEIYHIVSNTIYDKREVGLEFQI